LAEPIQKRLRLFVLRSKAQISEASELWVLLGMAGPRVAEALCAWLGAGFQPGVQSGGGMVFEVPQGRYIAAIPAQAAPEAWKSLRDKLRPVGSPCWEWLDIRSGIPMIVPATQGKLVPQMANLDLIGGVSFSKGCYTGQEVVARAQYLGKVKRRMYLAKLPGDAAPQAGDELYSDDLGDQASGLVVNAQASPETGYDLLAVAQMSSKESSVVRLKSPGGPALQFLPLPYEVK
jgi:folate-binding protein YgfZ